MSGRLRDGNLLYVEVHPIDGWPDERGGPYDEKYRVKDLTWRVRKFSAQGNLVETFTMKVVDLPWREASWENYGTILQLDNGDLLAPFQCHINPPEGNSYTFTTFIARSGDGGKTFRHVWTFNPIRDGKKTGQEGFDDPDLALLPNGDILCIMRTGGGSPMYQPRSKDGGKTWSEPVSIGWPGVRPRLRVLSNGVLACSSGRGIYGRPQVTYVMFSIDGTGEIWEQPFVFHNGPGCSYTSNFEAQGKLIVVYSHSARSSDPVGTPRLRYNSIKWVSFDVQKARRR